MQRKKITPLSADLKADLYAYFEKEHLDRRYIDALYLGYCNDDAVINCVNKWFQDCFPQRKWRYSPKDLAWADTLHEKIAFIQESSDISQGNINNKLSAFCQKYLPGSSEITGIKKGWCTGYTAVVSCSLMQNIFFLNSPTADNNTFRDDWLKLKIIFEKIANWDEEKPLSPRQIHQFTKILWLLKSFQDVHDYSPVCQGDFHESINSKNDKKLNLHYAIGAHFTERNRVRFKFSSTQKSSHPDY